MVGDWAESGTLVISEASKFLSFLALRLLVSKGATVTPKGASLDEMCR